MSKNICPFLKKTCIEHDCALYMHVQMQTNPQSGKTVDEFGCALAWTPIMMIEASRQTRGVQAAVESTRNEIVKRQDILNGAIDAASQGRQLGAGDETRLIDGGGGTLPRLRSGPNGFNGVVESAE